ncbi:hypothetical protein G5B46_19455 [Caulobacter sp. 602-2]|uniref:Uncharacterized protein n=1 Tax=Caulobacter sp. 602-2 TaxID=2710887 RepID=A0A6G4R1J9_9CAUL|nr:hypothetical protein [Caulobacter sp. 602-2]NGM51796.1 hypothetical protein [Caulobacter sp. 602-2]
MRELTLEELDFVTGGADEVDGITVTADGGDGDGWDGWWDGGDGGDGWWDGGDGGVGPDGGGDGITEEYPPCVEASPEGVAPGAILDTARSAAAQIAAGNDETFEYGALIWELNGTVGMGAIYTQNDTGQVQIGSSGVPDGARIVGYVHNHPDVAGVDDRTPSNHVGGDWDQYNALVNSTTLPRGITADPNMLLFIYTNEDGSLRAYDKTDEDTETASCAV